MRAVMEARDRRQDALTVLYQHQSDVDFSHQLLATMSGSALHVEAVAECGWSDLGTPERIGQAISMLVHSGHWPLPAGVESGAAIDLSARYLQSLLAAARESLGNPRAS